MQPGLYGAVIEGKTLCEGYANFVYEACKNAGIPARIIGISGKYNNEDEEISHSYNEVYLDGKWRTVDTSKIRKDSTTYQKYLNIDKPIEEFYDITIDEIIIIELEVQPQ